MKTVLVMLFIWFLEGCAADPNSVIITEGRGYFTGTKYCAVIVGNNMTGMKVTYKEGTCNVEVNEIDPPGGFEEIE